MTGGQRARMLKTGGVIAFVLLLLYLFTSRDGAGVRDMVKGIVDKQSRTEEVQNSLTSSRSSNVLIHFYHGREGCRAPWDNEVLEVQLQG